MKLFEKITEAVGSAVLDKNRLLALRERVKELECFYGISRILEQPNLLLKDILGKIVKLLPPAWLYPEITTARIFVDRESFTTDQFKETPQRLSSEIYVEGLKRGSIEVFYLEEMPAIYEGPFLLEERKLLDAIARQLSQIIKRKISEEENVKLQEQIRHADRLATVGQLAAGVAHELNEPLANILGFSQIILDETELTGQVRKDVKKIEKASLYARDVVKKLLFFSRQMPQNKTNININQILESSFFFFESRCVKEGLIVVKKLNSQVPEIFADSSQLQQVIINLIVNAIQAMSLGDTLTLITNYDNENIVLTIEDTGVGMSEEVIKQIFTPFYTTKEVDQGTGLGLSVVHGIVTSHGGAITVESKVDEGSRFEITLPINYNEKK